MSRSKRLPGRRSLCAVLVLAAACGADSGSDGSKGGRGGGATGGTGAGAGGGAGTSAGGAGASGGSVARGECEEDAECESDEFCSAMKVCVKDGRCLTDGDCDTGEVCDEGHTCVPGGECGGDEFSAEPVDANVMLVLDRSCSMKQKGDPSGKPKWQIAVEAINAMTTTFADHIRWGLILFPDKTAPNCDQTPGAPHIAIADGTGPAIQTLLTSALDPSDVLYPSGPCVTNIDTGVAQASADPALKDATRGNYVLLISDGEQSLTCGGNAKNADTQAAISSMAALGIGTFVVGFGEQADPAALDEFARLGGHPNPAPESDFYPASDQVSLETALDTIASSVIGCEFMLAEPPKDPNELYVFLNDEMVARDPTMTNGWEYDAATMQVAFFGAPCDGLRDGSLTDVDIVYGCPVPTPE